MGRNVARKLGSFVLSLTIGCGLFGDDDPAITLSASATSVSLLQAASASITIDIGRTKFEKPVTLALEGTLPTGVTAVFAQNPIAAGNSSTLLTITATGAATPGTAALTITASGEGITGKSVLVDVTLTARGSHTLGLANSTMTVAQGGGGQSTVLLARQNSNTGNVTLSASGAPAGMTVTFGESPTTATATSLTISASGSVAPGNYNVSISGSQPGVTNPTPAVLAVSVVPAPATASTTVAFCVGQGPVWFAYQNDGFLWQRVTGSADAYTFNATDKVAIAFAYTGGSESDVRFYYATRSELSAITTRNCFGSKTHPGTTANLGTAGTGTVAIGFVSMGDALDDVSSSNSYVLEGVQDRALDLVATRGQLTSSFLYTPDRVVIRRGVNLANNASIPLIDFTGPESVVPVTNAVTITGVDASENVYVENRFLATTESVNFMCSTQSLATTHTTCSVPAASLVAGDVHELYIEAFLGLTSHDMAAYFGSSGDRSETLGPNLTTPTVSLASAAPYARERGQLPLQTAYPTATRFVFLQGQSPARKFVVVVLSAGYLGGAPATWDAIVPDLTGVPGFNSAWMHAAGQSTAYSAEAFSAPGPLLFGAAPLAGQTIKSAYRQSSFTTTSGSALRAATVAQRRATAAARRALLNPAPQYLRR